MDNLPFEITYDIVVPPPRIVYDAVDSWDKINYNDHFKDNAIEIIESRFPRGTYDHIPGFEKVIKTMASNLKITTPLDEMPLNESPLDDINKNM